MTNFLFTLFLVFILILSNILLLLGTKLEQKYQSWIGLFYFFLLASLFYLFFNQLPLDNGLIIASLSYALVWAPVFLYPLIIFIKENPSSTKLPFALACFYSLFRFFCLILYIKPSPLIFFTMLLGYFVLRLIWEEEPKYMSELAVAILNQPWTQRFFYIGLCIESFNIGTCTKFVQRLGVVWGKLIDGISTGLIVVPCLVGLSFFFDLGLIPFLTYLIIDAFYENLKLEYVRRNSFQFETLEDLDLSVEDPLPNKRDIFFCTTRSMFFRKVSTSESSRKDRPLYFSVQRRHMQSIREAAKAAGRHVYRGASALGQELGDAASKNKEVNKLIVGGGVTSVGIYAGHKTAETEQKKIESNERIEQEKIKIEQEKIKIEREKLELNKKAHDETIAVASKKTDNDHEERMATIQNEHTEQMALIKSRGESKGWNWFNWSNSSGSDSFPT